MDKPHRTKAATPVADTQGGHRDVRFLAVEALTEFGAFLAEQGHEASVFDDWHHAAGIVDPLLEARDLLGHAVATTHVSRGYWRFHNLGF